MPLNEASRKPRRSRWPLEFDLMGVPQSNRERQELLNAAKEIHQMSQYQSPSGNRFLSDKQTVQLTPEKALLLDQYLESMKMGGVGREIDLSKPVLVAAPPGGWPKFPCLAYHWKTGAMLQIEDADELKVVAKRGFKPSPSPEHDYSQIQARQIFTLLGDERVLTIAKKKAVAANAFPELSEADLAEMDAEEAKA
jgi:hypothetical protein